MYVLKILIQKFRNSEIQKFRNYRMICIFFIFIQFKLLNYMIVNKKIEIKYLK
jgi:hypothetical protein